METKQIVFTKPKTAELLTVECPSPKENEVTVRLSYTVISAGTERANFVGERNTIFQDEEEEAVFPRTVGYSGAGVVTAVGAGVDKFRCSLDNAKAYEETLLKIEKNEKIENILFSHAYEPWNKDALFGRESVLECLKICKKYVRRQL